MHFVDRQKDFCLSVTLRGLLSLGEGGLGFKWLTKWDFFGGLSSRPGDNRIRVERSRFGKLAASMCCVPVLHPGE